MERHCGARNASVSMQGSKGQVWDSGWRHSVMQNRQVRGFASQDWVRPLFLSHLTAKQVAGVLFRTRPWHLRA